MAPMIRNNQNGTQTGNLFDRSCYTKDGRCGNGKSVDADADVDVERRDARGATDFASVVAPASASASTSAPGISFFVHFFSLFL